MSQKKPSWPTSFIATKFGLDHIGNINNTEEKGQEKTLDDKAFNTELVVGILRLDYDYPVQLDDVDDQRSFQYKTIQSKVKGLTFKICQKGDDLPDHTKKELINTLKYFRSIPNIAGIIGDCGFMLNYQQLVLEENAKLRENEQKAQNAHRIPIGLSPLILIPSILVTLHKNEQLLVVTANKKNLDASFNGLMGKYFNYEEEYVKKRFIVVGGDEVDGFGKEIQNAKKIDIEKAKTGFIQIIGEEINDKNNNIGAILFECTQIPVFQTVIQNKFAVPVWDALDLADFIHSGSSRHAH